MRIREIKNNLIDGLAAIPVGIGTGFLGFNIIPTVIRDILSESEERFRIFPKDYFDSWSMISGGVIGVTIGSNLMARCYNPYNSNDFNYFDIFYVATNILSGVYEILRYRKEKNNKYQKIDAPPHLKRCGLIGARFLDAQSAFIRNLKVAVFGIGTLT